MEAGRYDLVVLGAGTAGIVASTYGAGLGARVGLVEREAPGGDCLFTGCIPSKSLLAAARLAQSMRTAGRLGLDPVEPQVDLARVMDHVRRSIERAGRPDTPAALERRGVELVPGTGRFTAPGRLDVDGRELRWRAAVIATGTSPALPALAGLGALADPPLTTHSVWDLRELPPRLAVIGGGPTGVELAQGFARLGSRVTLVESAPRLLPDMDAEAGELIQRVFEEEGIRLLLGTRAERVEPPGTLVAGGEHIAFDRLLAASGRHPQTGALGLASVGVATDERGFVRADARMRTTGDRIWAAGDVTGGPQFTHLAGHQGAAAALNALLRARRSVDVTAVPRVVFSEPEVAAVGLSEREVRAAARAAPVVLRHDYAESDRAITEASGRGFAKLVCDRRGRLLGALVAAPAAGEHVAHLGRLVAGRERVTRLAGTIHPYPTYAEGPARAAESWYWRSLLSTRSRRILRPLLRMLRALDRAG